MCWRESKKQRFVLVPNTIHNTNPTPKTSPPLHPRAFALTDDIFSTSSPFPTTTRPKRKLRSSQEERISNTSGSTIKKPKLDAYTLLCVATRRSRQQSLPKSNQVKSSVVMAVGRSDIGEKNEWINTIRSEGSIIRQDQERNTIDLVSPSPTKQISNPPPSVFKTPPTHSLHSSNHDNIKINQWQLLTPPASSPISLRSTERQTRSFRNDSPFVDGDDDLLNAQSSSDDDDVDDDDDDDDLAELEEARRRTMMRFGLGGRRRVSGMGGIRRGMLSEMTRSTMSVTGRQNGSNGFEEMRTGLLSGITGSTSRLGYCEFGGN